MLTETPTDAEIVEILATRGMGFKWHPATESHEEYLEQPDGPNVRVRLCVYRVHLLRDLGYLFTDLNAVRKIEERLSEGQREKYRTIMVKNKRMDPNLPYFWHYRHASARICCEALAEVLDETPAAPAASK